MADKNLIELRKQETQCISVEFDYRIEEAFLEKLPHVQSVKNTGGFIYEILFDTEEDMRPSVFDFAFEQQLKILSLNRKNTSLEELFRSLTSGQS